MRSARFWNRLIGRRAEQREVRGVDDAFERRLAAAQQDHELDLVRIDPLEGAREPRQLEEAEALRKRKILLQQPVALKRAQGHRQQRLGVGEADRLDRLPPEGTRATRVALFGGTHQRPEAGRQAQLVQLVRDVVASGQIEAQPIDRRLRELQARRSS